MISIIYLDLCEKEQISYEKEIITAIQSIDNTIISFDIDYQTDTSLIENAQQLINDSTASILYIESDNNYAHKIIPFAELYIQNPDKFIVFIEGENQWIKKLSKSIASSNLHENLSKEMIIELVSDFLNKKKLESGSNS